jgi:hypothetical protein
MGMAREERFCPKVVAVVGFPEVGIFLTMLGKTTLFQQSDAFSKNDAASFPRLRQPNSIHRKVCLNKINMNMHFCNHKASMIFLVLTSLGSYLSIDPRSF